jgi:hypothetical protein
MHGEGAFTGADGDKYVGQYHVGKKHGEGTYTYYTLPDGDEYVGQWQADKKHGEGTYINGVKYVGQWQADKKHGKDFKRNDLGEWFYQRWVRGVVQHISRL